MTEDQINRRWVEILLDTLSPEKPVTIGPRDASCFINALRALLSTHPTKQAKPVRLLNPMSRFPTEEDMRKAEEVRIERLRRALFEARDAMRVMSGWVRKLDPAGHAWAVHMVDCANAVLNGEPEPRAEVTECVHGIDDGACKQCYHDATDTERLD